MNAPWSSRGPLQRDPFTAYVCDDASADTIRQVATEMGWPPEKVNKGGLRNAVQSLSVSASPSILLVDISESSDPLNDINGLAEVCEPGTVVIAAGQINDVRLFRDLVASGIQDYLLKPLNVEQLRDAFTQAQAIFSAPRANDAGSEQPHVTTAVIGVRGGAGASTVANSLAWLFAEKAGRSTALLDLDVHFGTGALALDLEPGRGLTDAIENPARIDGLFLERAMVRATEKLAILSAEAPLHQPLMTDGSAFYQLQEEMRSSFESTVIDIPRHMLVQHAHLVHDAHSIVLVTEMTLASARDTIRVLSHLKSSSPQARVTIVANRVHTTGPQEVSRKDFESSIERRVDFVVPFDSKSAVQAAQMGKALVEAARTTKAGSALSALSEHVLTQVDGADPVASGKSKSLLGKLGDFKALMPKKSVKLPA